MSYSSNPLLPKARAQAVRLVVVQRLPLTVAARRSGIHRVTLWRWKQRWLGLNQHVQFSNDNRPSRSLGKQFRLTSWRWLLPTNNFGLSGIFPHGYNYRCHNSNNLTKHTNHKCLE